MKGLYFWASNLIVLRSLTHENIAKAVGDMIGKQEFERAFSVATPPSIDNSLV